MKNSTKQLLVAALAHIAVGSAYAAEDAVVTIDGQTVEAAQWVSPTDRITLTAEDGADIYYGFSTSNNASREPAEYTKYTEPFAVDVTQLASSNGNTYLWYYVEYANGDESEHINLNLRYAVVVNSLADWKQYSSLPSASIVLNIADDAGVAVVATDHNTYYNGWNNSTTANFVYLWDGQDGILLTGSNINGDAAEGTVQYFLENNDLVGHTVSGQVKGALTTASTNAGRLTSNHQTASTAAHNVDLTVGGAATVAPLALTLSDLQQALEDGNQLKYAYAYVKIDDVNVVKKNNSTYQLKQGDVTFDLSDTEAYYVQANKGVSLAEFMAGSDGYDGKKGNFTGVVRASASTYLLSPVAEGWFEVTGDAEREKVEFDALSADNAISAKNGVDVTIKNLSLQAGVLATFYSPLQLDLTQFENVFGEGAKLYQTSMYNVKKDDEGTIQVGFNPVELSATTRTGGFYNYVVIPTKDVNDPTFENVSIQNVSTNEAGKADLVYFWGTANARELSTDGTCLLIGTDESLYIPQTDAATIKGFSCYFELNADEVSTPIVLTIGDRSITTSVSCMAADLARVVPSGVYTLGGQRIGTDASVLKRGVYVIEGHKYVVK